MLMDISICTPQNVLMAWNATWIPQAQNRVGVVIEIITLPPVSLEQKIKDEYLVLTFKSFKKDGLIKGMS